MLLPYQTTISNLRAPDLTVLLNWCWENIRNQRQWKAEFKEFIEESYLDGPIIYSPTLKNLEDMYHSTYSVVFKFKKPEQHTLFNLIWGTTKFPLKSYYEQN